MNNSNKKETKGDIERRMRNAVVLVPRDKYYQGVYFDDKGLRLEITGDYAVVTTGFHRHVFTSFTSQGVSKPYVFIRRFIELALSEDCMVKDQNGNVTRSYAKLMSVLDAKEDKKDFNIAWYVDLWLNNIFHPLYSIGDTETESFLVYETFLHNTARNKVILSEKIDDMTNIGFVNAVTEEERKFVEGIAEHVVFKKKTDEEKMKENVEAISEEQQETSN